MDNEIEGGIGLDMEIMDGGGGIEAVHDDFIKPEPSSANNEASASRGPSPGPQEAFPRLPSQSMAGDVTSSMSQLGLNDKAQSSSWQNPQFQLSAWDKKDPTPREASIHGPFKPNTSKEKVWGDRKGKTASNVLFPDAQPTPPPKDFAITSGTSNEVTPRSRVLNMMSNRFWDPMSPDWVPERFYDSAASKYHCPFPCE